MKILGFAQDLSGYSEPVHDVGQSTNDFIWKRHPRMAGFMLFLTLGFYVLIGYGELAYTTPEGSAHGAEVYAFIVFILPLFLLIVPYFLVRYRMRNLFFTQLASSLGLTYQKYGSVNDLSGDLFSRGDSRVLKDILSGSYQDLGIRLYNYEYETGEGKSRQTHHYLVGELTAPGALPYILIKPKSALQSVAAAFANAIPGGRRELSLEGDFGKHFTVYVDEGAEIEGLQVLEPDVMHALMSDYKRFSVECHGNKVYVYKEGSLAENRTELTSLIKLLESLYAELAPEVKAFSD